MTTNQEPSHVNAHDAKRVPLFPTQLRSQDPIDLLKSLIVFHASPQLLSIAKPARYGRKCTRCIYSNKRRGAYLIFRTKSAALIRGRRLFKHCTRQIYFFYIFIQRYNFYLLIFPWPDTKLIVNLKLREKVTRRKKGESLMITRAKISAVRASGVRRLFEGYAY